MAQNAAVLGIRYFFVDLIGGVVLFPLWWYSRGLMRMVKFIGRSFAEERMTLGIGIWLKNIFVPMYGSRDITGRLVSIFMRIVQIIGRSIVLVIYGLLMLVLLMAYLVLPILVIMQILFHFTSLFL